jgi:hypothetical protein
MVPWIAKKLTKRFTRLKRGLATNHKNDRSTVLGIELAIPHIQNRDWTAWKYRMQEKARSCPLRPRTTGLSVSAELNH